MGAHDRGLVPLLVLLIGATAVAVSVVGWLSWTSSGPAVGLLQANWQDITDDDYNRDVERGVLNQHRGFPDLPDCPTEGLWGSYRPGYIPGQPGGNCQDVSLKNDRIAAHKLGGKKGFNVRTWNQLWKEDMDALKKRRSYAKLTKGLWKGIAPHANLAYYVPNNYKGSLKRYYERPGGEASETQNMAHSNSIVPDESGRKTRYYKSDFHKGHAILPTPVRMGYGNIPHTTEVNNMNPVTQGLHQKWKVQEKKVIGKLQALNQAERSRLRASSRVVALARGAAAGARKHRLTQLSTMTGKGARTKSRSAGGLHIDPVVNPTPMSKDFHMLSAQVGQEASPQKGDESAETAQEKENEEEEMIHRHLKHFKHLRQRFRSWRKYFTQDQDSNGLEDNFQTQKHSQDRVYFWCYSHYADYEPDRIEGSYPEFEECLHDLGSVEWGSDEVEAQGPSDEDEEEDSKEDEQKDKKEDEDEEWQYFIPDASMNHQEDSEDGASEDEKGSEASQDSQ